MSQNSLVMPTTGTVTGLQMAQNVNAALDTLASLNGGPSAPATTQAGMFWLDTSVNGAYVLKQRNSANNGWITIGPIDAGMLSRSGGTMTGDLVVPSLNGGPLAGQRNRIINGNFAFNQRSVSGTVTLAAGAYGHDRWRAGSSGCTYTFSTSGTDTIITITAGSLMQIVESVNVEGGVYALSHAGTAQARIAVNGAATSGAYAAATAAAPLLSASATANQAVTVEFSTGTINKAQLEPGTTATPFERRHYAVEYLLCRRYFRWHGDICIINPIQGQPNRFALPTEMYQGMRTTPLFTFYNSANSAGYLSEFSSGTSYAISTSQPTWVQPSATPSYGLVLRASSDCEL